MTVVRFLLAGALVEFAGLGLLSRLRREPRSGPGFLGLGFVVGVLAVGLWTHLLVWVRVPVNLWTVAGGALVMGAAGRWSVLREAVWKRPPWPAALLGVAAAGLLLCALSGLSIGWDPEIFYSLKAKSIVHYGTIWNEDFTDPDRLHIARRRPLLLPAIYADVYLMTGSFENRLLRVWFTLFQFGAFAAMYDAFRGRMERVPAALGVALYAWLPTLFRDVGGAITGWADAPLAMVFFLALASETPLAILFLTAGALLKDDGQAFLVTYAITRGWKPALFPAAVAAAWLLTARSFPADMAYLVKNFLHPSFDMIPAVLRKLGSEFLTLKHWGIFWALALLFVGLKARRLTREDTRWLLPVAIQLAFYVGVWITFPRESILSNMRVQDARLVLHVTPIMCYWLAWRGSEK